MSEIEFRKNAVNPSNCIREGWNLIKPNYGVFFGMATVAMLIIIAIGFIPYLGEFIGPFVSGPLTCGIFFAMLAESRGETAKFSMLLEGFKRFLPSFLVSLITTIPYFILSLTTYLFGFLQEQTLNNANDSGISVSHITDSDLATFLPIFVAVLVSSVIGLLLFFALPLIADRNLNFAEAARLSIGAATSNFGGLIVLFVLEMLITLAGLLAFCIGVLFVLPVIYASYFAAYRSVFPEEQSSFFNEPP